MEKSLVQSITDSFKDGDSKPEVVTLYTSMRRRRDFSIESDCPKYTQWDQSKILMGDDCGSYKMLILWLFTILKMLNVP